MTEEQEQGSSSSSLTSRFRQARILLDSGKALDALEAFQCLQRDITSIGLFSSNESTDDISTPSLQLLAIDYLLGLSYTSLPASPGEPNKRKDYLIKAMNHFSQFLEIMLQLEELTVDEKKEYEQLSEIKVEDEELTTLLLPAVSRDVKIVRFRAKNGLQKQLDQLQSLHDRRQRLGLQEEDEMDGYDQDGLVRYLYQKQLSLYCMEALEEWSNALRELPMIAMMMQHSCGSDTRKAAAVPPPPTNKPMQLTHITKDKMTGQLNIRKEEVRSQVFRPGWNQPTMSLEELADREVSEAMEREARQAAAEEAQKDAPRRYDQLVQDGMEDNAALVDASAALDRAWDDFKAENPRGSGNKMGDRGDRNF